MQSDARDESGLLAAQGEEFRDDGRAGHATVGQRAQSEARRTLTAEDLAPLTRIVSWRSGAAVLQTWLIITLTLVAALAYQSWATVLVAIVVIGTQQHALFILSHEAAHYRLFGNRAINDLIGCACATVAGLSMRTYRVIHRLHHNHLYGPEDPDIALHGGYPRGKWYLIRKLIKDLSGLTAVKTYRYFFGNPAKSDTADRALDPLADTSPRLRAEGRADQKRVIAVQLALPVLMILLGGWKALGLYLLLWVVPAITVLQAILRLRAVCEHGAVADMSSPLTAARTHASSASANWLVARALLFPHHVNYHIEHHLYPAVPHYHLRQLHDLLASRGVLNRSEVSSIDRTLRKIFAEARPLASRLNGA
jgi:fatty acid desaturase